MTNNKTDLENKKFGLSAKARKAFCAAFLAGGLFGGQAVQAAPTIPDRVAAVRSEMNKRLADVQQLGGTEAVQKQLASWLNWVNWPNWNNWRDWNNWRNWSNWPNWFNF
jgi:hypothetical protein